MELARVAFCRTILACETPLQGLCAKRGELPASMVRVEVIGFKQVSQSQLAEGLAFLTGYPGIRLQACLKAHSVVGSIFKMRLPWDCGGLRYGV